MESPIKNMAYWKAKNASPAKSGLGLKHKSDKEGFDMDHDEYNPDGSPNYNDPTDPTSPNYNPKHGGSDYMKLTVDPDAPGTPGEPGYEPTVKRSDFDEGSEQQKMFDGNQAKIKAKKKK